MSDEWKKSVCQQPLTCSITSIGDFFIPVSDAEEALSPIDRFYAEIKRIIDTGRPEVLTQFPEIGALLLVSSISSTENYFREVFSKIIKICPISQGASSDKAIPISSIVWHGSKDIERGALEGQSLACSDYIIKASKNFLKYHIDKDLGAQIFDEFEKLCQVRHNIVHSSCIVAGKNAVALAIPSSDRRLKIVINYANLQEALAVCSALVIGANKNLFIEMCKRWAVDWVKLPSWSASDEYKKFKILWSLFYSKIDAQNGRLPSRITPVKANNEIKKFYRNPP